MCLTYIMFSKFIFISACMGRVLSLLTCTIELIHTLFSLSQLMDIVVISISPLEILCETMVSILQVYS